METRFVRQLRTYISAIILCLVSGKCLASSPSASSPSYAMTFLAVILTAVLVIGGLVAVSILERRSINAGSPRWDHSGVLLLIWILHALWSQLADQYAAVRSSYDLIALPLGVGVLISVFADGIAWWIKNRPISTYWGLWLLFSALALDVFFEECWKIAWKHTPVLRYEMAGIALAAALLSLYLFFSKKDGESSQTDGRSDELSDGRGTSPIV